MERRARVRRGGAARISRARIAADADGSDGVDQDPERHRAPRRGRRHRGGARLAPPPARRRAVAVGDRDRGRAHTRRDRIRPGLRAAERLLRRYRTGPARVPDGRPERDACGHAAGGGCGASGRALRAARRGAAPPSGSAGAVAGRGSRPAACGAHARVGARPRVSRPGDARAGLAGRRRPGGGTRAVTYCRRERQGHVFRLGLAYTEPLDVGVLDDRGQRRGR